MVRLIGHLYMTIAVDWDDKPLTKQTKHPPLENTAQNNTEIENYWYKDHKIFFKSTFVLLNTVDPDQVAS